MWRILMSDICVREEACLITLSIDTESNLVFVNVTCSYNNFIKFSLNFVLLRDMADITR